MEATLSTTSAPPPFFTARATAALLIQTALYSLLSGWTLGLLPLPAAGWMDAGTLPLAFTVIAILGAALFSPLMEDDQRTLSSPRAIGLAIFSAAWQGLLLFFFLQLAARLSPLAANGSLAAALWLFQIALLLQFTARVLPTLYPAIAFAWIAALPIFAYWIVELVLIGSGGMNWKELKGANTESVVLVVRTLLQSSPLPALLGALSGTLLDGSTAMLAIPMITLSLINSVLGWRCLKN